jgi:hypothetical protein
MASNAGLPQGINEAQLQRSQGLARCTCDFSSIYPLYVYESIIKGPRSLSRTDVRDISKSAVALKGMFCTG